MCGIAGIQLNTTSALLSEQFLNNLATLLAHRGPDGRNHLAINNTALVHTRLAIIDLSGGTQPLSLNQVHLVANGEIYNYKELASEFSPLDLKTHSDCELPLHLWQIMGADFVKKLRGMYAIAVYDDATGILSLSRDPFGIKPLYYAKLDNGIAFASEPQALIKSGLVKARLNDTAREEFLQLQFSMGAKTIFAGINRVLPGETLSCKDGQIISSTRQEALVTQSSSVVSDSEALLNLEKCLSDSVSVHLRTDVPYGVFLSGGIDSSVILGLTARLTEQPILCFTAGFDVPEAVDERLKAAKMAASVGARHESIEINESMVWQHLPKIVAAMDDPCADYAIIPTWFLARFASQEVKVILSGEGGDELFGGYGRYQHFMRHPLLGRKKMRARGSFDRVKNILRESPKAWRRTIELNEQKVAGLYRSRLMQAQALDCADWLPHDLLLKLDRCLMAHNIEGRTPFLDPLVAKFAFNLPDHLKVRAGFAKWILRQWLHNNFPAAAAFSPKQGFTVPIADWINKKSTVLGQLVAAQAGVAEIAEADKVLNLYNNIGRQKGAGAAAWILLFYALWHQHHILGCAVDGDTFEVLSA